MVRRHLAAVGNCTLVFQVLCIALVSVLSPALAQGALEYPDSEVTLSGAVLSGSLGSGQLLQEQEATVGPPPKRADLLEHIWIFEGIPSGSYQLVVSAYREDTGGDGDDFRFSISVDGGANWTTAQTVSNSAPAVETVYGVQQNLSGEVQVRVVDTDRTKAHRNLGLLFVGSLFLAGVEDPPEPPPPPYPVSGKRIIGYYTSWSVYGREYYVNEYEAGVDHIPAEKVTHINYAFANLLQDGTVVVGDEFADVNKAFGNEAPGVPFKGNFQQLKILKENYPHIKTLISVGGWTWSDHFSDVFANDPYPNSRTTFCSSLLDFVETYGFDGADINWEHPGDPGEGDNSFRPGEDAANYVATLAECYPMFQEAGKLLTIANACAPGIYGDNEDLAAMAPYLDWINLMAYDLRGAWDPVTGHHSQLYPHTTDPYLSEGLSLSECVAGHVAEVPPEKLNAGIPTYGRSYARVEPGFGGDAPGVLGLFQPFSGVPRGTWDGGKWGTTGIFDYEDIVENLIPGGDLEYDDTAGVATLTWSLGRKLGLGFLSFDNAEAVCGKARFSLLQNLGGVMFWEFSADLEEQPESLIQAMFCGLNPDFEICQSRCP